VAPKRPTECPNPDKRKFPSKAKAKRFHRDFQSTWKTRQWPYECETGDHWHLTSAPPQEQIRIRRQIDEHLGRTQDWQKKASEL
jgi:hypothetical protein